MTAMKEPRDGYAQALLELGAQHDDVFVLDGDCATPNYTIRFRNAYPERFVNIGIAECDIIGTAAGLSLLGKVPFANAYANFLTGRGYDQIRVSVAYCQRNVKIAGHNAGTTAVHKATLAAYEFDGPVYLRVGKLPVPELTGEETPFTIGKAVTMREGSDVTLVSTGCILSEVLKAAEILKTKGVKAEVLHVHTVKPIDAEAIVTSATKTGAVVSAEEHSILNGLGSAVAEVLGENLPVPLERIGTRDIFGLSGTMDELFDYFGLRAENIADAARRAISRKA